MLKTLSKLNTCVYYWNSVENTPNTYGKRFPPLLKVFPATPTVVNNSVGNGFYDAFPGNSSTQNELKSKKTSFLMLIFATAPISKVVYCIISAQIFQFSNSREN